MVAETYRLAATLRNMDMAALQDAVAQNAAALFGVVFDEGMDTPTLPDVT
jgi:hypothetical protein